MKMTTRIRVFNPFLKQMRFYGFLSLSLIQLAGCGLVSLHKSSPSSDSLSTRPAHRESPYSLSVKALLMGDETKARDIAKTITDRREQESLIGLIREWSLGRQIENIRQEFEHGKNLDAFDLFVKLQNQSPDRSKDLLLLLTPDDLSWVLRHEIHINQEKLAIRTMNLLQPYKQSSFRKDISSSYAHWAVRRFWQRRYYESLKLASRSLSFDPTNKKARNITKRIHAIRDAEVSRGLVAYRHQHLKKAIRLWKGALAIDPSIEEPKNYILKAKELLKKVENLQVQSGKSTPPTQEEKK